MALIPLDLTHQFLLSMPQMQDSLFSESVVYLLDHGENGAFGLIINQPVGMALDGILTQLNIGPGDDMCASIDVLCGGPVDQDHGLVLHPAGFDYESTQHFTSGLSMSSSLDALQAIARGEGPADYHVFLGHSGWAPGQLEEEIINNAWLTCAASSDIIFRTPLKERRQAVGTQLGIRLEQMVGHAGHA